MLDFRQFQVLTFDCYGTLIDWESGIFGALRPILSSHGKTLSSTDILELYGDLEAKAEQGPFRSYREVLHSVVRGFGEKLGFSPTDAEVRSLPESMAKWTPFPDTVPALQKLKQWYQLAIVSNVDDDLFQATAKKLEVPFDFVITAQQAQCYKPDFKIFNLALDEIAMPPDSILHCAQSVYHDVVPAKQLGLSSVWVNRPSLRHGIGAVRPAYGEPDMEVPNLETLARLAMG